MDHLDYRIEFTPAAVRQLRKVDPQTRRRIQAAVELLATQPRPPGAKKLVGGDGEWRVRTGATASCTRSATTLCWFSSSRSATGAPSTGIEPDRTPWLD
jgi:hypothetical protein